jgi:hypothetical protein
MPEPVTIFVATVTVSGLLYIPFLQLEELLATERIGISNDPDNNSHYSFRFLILSYPIHCNFKKVYHFDKQYEKNPYLK